MNMFPYPEHLFEVHHATKGEHASQSERMAEASLLQDEDNGPAEDKAQTDR
jgi:hypothetical protein